MNKEPAEQKTDAKKPSRILVNAIDPQTQQFDIPKEGFSFKGLFTLFVILFWLMMILIWTVLLVQYGFVWTLLSIPFWLLGGVTLRLALKMIFASQQFTVNHEGMTIVKKYEGKTSSISFSRDKISDICLVEGSYKTLSGITRKGVYPAVISNDQAYGFGERCSDEEKRWLLSEVKSALKIQ